MAHDRWYSWPQPRKRAQTNVPHVDDLDDLIQAVAWTVERLVTVCRTMSLGYEERTGYDQLLGTLLSLAGSTRISVKASLPQPVKIYAIAYALARIALDNYNGMERICYLDQSMARGLAFYHNIAPGQDRTAHIWATHLLVRPSVYQKALRLGNNDETVAARITAKCLNIPVHAVILWQAHRDWTFSEDPMEWLGRVSLARAAKEGMTM